MNANQYRLMFIPLLATLIMGGFVTTVGLLTEPAAIKYGVELTDIASQFTWFTGGVFLGGILAFFVFDYFAIKPVILWSYVVSVGLILWLHFSAQYFLLPFLLYVSVIQYYDQQKEVFSVGLIRRALCRHEEQSSRCIEAQANS